MAITPITRRAALAASGLLLGDGRRNAGKEEDFQRVLDGDGDPRHALCGFAGMAFDRPDAPARTAVALGRAHIESDRAMSTESPMRIASISKHVTTIGFLRLFEQGKIGLDDDVSDPLGFRLRHPLFPGTPITPRRLLSHTSGVRNGPSYPVPFGRPLSAALVKGGAQYDNGAWWSPAKEPPGWFAYSDANFAIVAQLIERLSGERFDHYMTAHVFAPLKLDCGFNWSGVTQAARSRAAALYRKGVDENHFQPDGPWIAQLDVDPPPAPAIPVVRAPEAKDRPLDSYVPGENGFVFAPQGGLRASVRDLATIARLLANGGALGDPGGGVRLLKPATVALMRTPVWRYDPAHPNGEPYGGGGILAYGLGTCILTGAQGPNGDDLFPGCGGWVGHLGEAYGLLSGLWVNPKTGAGMVYMLNGVSSPHAQNPGVRSAYTWQEERLATDLAST
jgi:CubicO group peptidase (beta-lactamase class C family)